MNKLEEKELSRKSLCKLYLLIKLNLWNFIGKNINIVEREEFNLMYYQNKGINKNRRNKDQILSVLKIWKTTLKQSMKQKEKELCKFYNKQIIF